MVASEAESLVKNEVKKTNVQSDFYCIDVDYIPSASKTPDSIVAPNPSSSKRRAQELAIENSKRLLDKTKCGHLTPQQWIDELDSCDMKYVTQDGHTLLHSACDRGFAAVKRCVELGADVNVQSSSSETPLSWAIVNGDIRMARCLIDHDAQVDIKIYGINFCHVAARSENSAMLYFLLRYKPEMTQMLLDLSEAGFSPLHYAAQYDKFIVVQYLLLQFGLDSMVKDSKGNTPLHIATSKNAKKAVNALLRFGNPQQIYVRNDKDELPIDLAMSRVVKRDLHFQQTRQEFSLTQWFDKVTKDRYRFGITMHFPTIFTIYVICQIAANTHLWIYLSPYNSPLTVYTLSLASVVIFLMWFSTTQADPGIIPKRKFNEISEEFDQLLFRGDTRKICVTCGVVRPWRSKHVAEIDACVMRFDHYCPWIGNAVGSWTQMRFLAFVTLQPFIQAIYVYLNYHWMKDDSIEKTWPGYLLGIIMGIVAILLVIYGIFMTGNVCYLISRNMTTNEAMNHFNFEWYEIPGTMQTNLYDMGILTNWFNVVTGKHDMHRPKSGWSHI